MSYFAGGLAIVLGILLLVLRKQIPKIVRALLVRMYGEDSAETFTRPRIDPWLTVGIGILFIGIGATYIISAI